MELRHFAALPVLATLLLSQPVLAADTAATSPALSLVKTMLGLMLVLAVMAGIAWVMKRVGPVKRGGHSVARIVGGVSVGPREKVVVIEVANRWLVVGVAAGQVNGIANLDMVEGASFEQDSETGGVDAAGIQSLARKGQGFASWLKHSLEKSRGA